MPPSSSTSTTTLRNINVKVPVKVNFCGGRGFFRREAMSIEGHSNVAKPFLRDMYDRLNPELLRWRVIPHASHKTLPLSTQRSKLRNKWSSALVAALRTKGYQSNGLMMEKDKNGIQKTGLIGTMEIVPYDGAGFRDDAATLQLYAGKIIDAIESQQPKRLQGGKRR